MHYHVERTPRLRQRILIGCLSLLMALACLAARPAMAQQPNLPPGVNYFRSQHFVLYTDLSAEESKDLLERVEYMLGLISFYWQRAPVGVIDMYVAKNVDVFPAGFLPNEECRANIAAGAGITTGTSLGAPRPGLYKATVYAHAENGMPQHEAVHAYCFQTFGEAGPVWYSEGMADMGLYWKKNQKEVQIFPWVAEYLQSSDPKSLNGIVNNQEATGDSWQNYAWRWALCHLLEMNPNYNARFRPFGQSILLKKEVTFEQVYGDMANEVSFEYLFFLEHLGNGYRVDLTAWDWKKRFVPLVSGRSLTARVMAMRGWQPTGAMVNTGGEYEYTVTGTWSVGTNEAPAEPQGASGFAATKAAPSTSELGNVQLVVMSDDYQLSEPIDLEKGGTFTVPADGNLYVRINDDWCRLSDNTGTATLKITAAK